MQNALASEEEEILVTILRAWLDSQLPQKDVQGKEQIWTDPKITTRLLAELNQVAKNESIEYTIRGTSALTRRIKENAAMFKAEGIVYQVKHGDKGTEWLFKLPKKDVKKIPSEPSVLSVPARIDPQETDRSPVREEESVSRSVSQNHAQPDRTDRTDRNFQPSLKSLDETPNSASGSNRTRSRNSKRDFSKKA